MMTLNDSLRAEFKELIEEENFQNLIDRNELDSELIYSSFEVLLNEKRNFNDINRGRSLFQNHIINTLKS